MSLDINFPSARVEHLKDRGEAHNAVRFLGDDYMPQIGSCNYL
ncbi:hypothetical protein AURMO_01126 [Aurantimicrobium photophilum]|uniref:Uncharacterized protein n=1 Tax=Aurantimicrobium photophilum TaxID=1987356 RepID=A0A2Z3RYX2_9MICO|nr:hypothetical protein AURMO_01126 [Aurantimicrobium photophilum]